MERTLRLRIGILAALLLITIFVYTPFDWFPKGSSASVLESFNSGACEAGVLCVSFFDVGQGDAIYIESPSGVQMLVDGGRDSNVLQDIAGEVGFFDKSIDYVLSTHPDLDHIAGLVEVLSRYEVGTIIESGNRGDTPVADAFNMAVKDENAKIITARKGDVIDLGSGVTLNILFPDRDVSETESNTASIVARLVYGETEFLLTGDSPKNIEEYLVLTEGEHLESDVLKVGHHGSRTSTSELFLDEVSPEFAIISASKDNSYGHPHVEVTDLLFNSGVTILETAKEGTITFLSDGTEIKRATP